MMLKLVIEVHIPIVPNQSDFIDQISHGSIMQEGWSNFHLYKDLYN